MKKKIDEVRVNRREAIGKLTKIMALAVGMGTQGLRKLLAQVPAKKRTGQKRNAIVMQKSINEDIKQLKVMIENNKRVFANEYGRITPVRQIGPGIRLPNKLEGLTGSFCLSFFGDSGVGVEGMDWCIGTNMCNGQDLCPSDEGTPGDVPACDGTNVCNGQTCHLEHCRKNACRNQTCNGLASCDSNKQAIKACVTDLIEANRNDPYIQLLFQQFNQVNTAELIQRLEIRVDSFVKR